MRHRVLSVLVACALLIPGCNEFQSPQTQIREKTWSEFKEKLKSPSSAKLVSCEVTESTNESDRLKYYLKTKYALENLYRLMDLAKNYGINIKDPTLIHSTSDFDPEVGNRLESELRDKKSKREIINSLQNVIKFAIQKYTNEYTKDKYNIKLFYVSIIYDAANSYGAVLRGKALGIVIWDVIPRTVFLESNPE